MFSPILRCLTVAVLLLFTSVAPHIEAAGNRRRDPSIAIRLHVQTAGYDPTFAAKVKIGNPPREVIVEKIPSLSERDIASFYPYQAADGTYSVVLQLDRHGEATLEAISSERRGSLIVVLVNGLPVNSLLIDKRIMDGIVFIPGGLTVDNIKQMGESFRIMGQPERGMRY